MANNYNTSDLVKGVLGDCGENTDGTSPYQGLALEFINNVYKNLLNGANEFDPEIGDAWGWASVSKSFTVPPFQSGTATMAAGSTSGVFSIAPTISLVGYDFHVMNQNTNVWYGIVSHTANSTAFEINSGYVDSPGLVSFRAAPLTFDLGPGILRLVEPLRIYADRVLELGEKPEDQGRIYGMSVLEFWKKWPLRYVLNDVPSKFTTISQSEDEWVIRFNKYVTLPLKFDFDYIAIPDQLVDSSSSIPLVPLQYRDFLQAGASFYLANRKNQPAKADTFYKIAQAKLRAMHLAEEKTLKLTSLRYGQLTARPDDSAVPWWLIYR